MRNKMQLVFFCSFLYNFHSLKMVRRYVMIHMVFFAPYPEILPTIEQVFRERPDREELDYKVVLDFFNNPLQDIDADVIIARGFTAHTMEKEGFVCAELKVTGYDVVNAITRCLSMHPEEKNIAIVGAYNMIYGVDMITSNFPSIHITSYPILDETELEATVEKAIADGNTAMVGGYTTVKIAKKHQIPAVMIESGRGAVNNAIAEAKAAAEISMRERARSNEIANIMNYSFQGIIAIDRNGVITMANNYCYPILADRGSSLVGRHIREFFPNLLVDEVTGRGAKILSELHKYKQLHLMVNCVPIMNEHEVSGAVLTFQNITQIQDEEDLIRKKLHRSSHRAKYHFNDIIHQSGAMDAAISDARNFSYSDSNILIYGETGTGKELFAQSIHNSSSRKNYPFVAINCAALPESLLESELFGYVEGAFTGAAKGGKMGFFEIAHRGTIFLDEIGDISASLQSRLLRVLQEREIMRLGSDTVISVDVRIISATNKNLKEEVAAGNFRQDLLYRLDVLELSLPPLRERGGDVAYLLDHFLALEHERTGRALSGLTAEAKNLLCEYSWPGNIREMRNFCERLSILCQTAQAGTKDVLRALPDAGKRTEEQEAAGRMTHPDAGKAYGTEQNGEKERSAYPVYDEKQAILSALAAFHNSRTKTAEFLNMNKSTLWRKMKKYNIQVPR